MRVTVLFPLKTTETEQDLLVAQIEGAVRANGHEADHVGFGDAENFVAWMLANRPEMVVNLYDQMGDQAHADIDAAGVLDFLQIPHTGGGASELAFQADKAVMKMLLRHEGIRTPEFAVFPPEGQMQSSGGLRFPLFVKPVSTDSSQGIDDRSYCETREELVAKVKSIHAGFGVAALAEEYIEGRELHAGVLGNEKPKALPVVETVFKNEGGGPNVLTAKAKFGQAATSTTQLAELDDETVKRVQRIAADSYRALHVADYGRLDLRLDPQGRIWVIEVNASPTLLKGDAFAMAAEADGIDYNALVGKIIKLALARQPERKPRRSSPGSPPAAPATGPSTPAAGASARG